MISRMHREKNSLLASACCERARFFECLKKSETMNSPLMVLNLARFKDEMKRREEEEENCIQLVNCENLPTITNDLPIYRDVILTTSTNYHLTILTNKWNDILTNKWNENCCTYCN